ncbi:hypothetical protein PG984_003841 [Apiospora sp. TS-2023a]
MWEMRHDTDCEIVKIQPTLDVKGDCGGGMMGKWKPSTEARQAVSNGAKLDPASESQVTNR